jgi:hypothetical protein
LLIAPQKALQVEALEGLASQAALEFGDASLVLIGAALAGAGILAVLGIFLLPAVDQVGMDLVFWGDLGDGQSAFEFAEELLFELPGVVTRFEAHG